MNNGTLTAILTQFATLFNDGISNVTPYAIALFVTIATIDLAKTFLLDLLESDPIKILVKKIFLYGLFYWFLNDYKMLVDAWLDGCVFVGLKAGGNVISTQQLTDPSYVITKGLEIAWPIMEQAKNQVGLSYENIPKSLTMVLCYVLIVFSFLVIAFQIFITYLEFYIIGALAVAFLPFGVIDKTAFLAEKAIGGIVSVGVKIMTLSFVLAAALPLLTTMSLPANVDQNGAFLLLGTAAAVALLCWQAPGLAAGLMSGHPSLSASSALGAVGAAASMAYMAKTVATGAAGMAVKVPGVRQGISAVQAAVGGMYQSVKDSILGNSSKDASSMAGTSAAASTASNSNSQIQKMLSDAQNQGGGGI